MRVTEIYHKKHPVISIEFFPYRDEKTQPNFSTVVDDLTTLNPDYLSVTFGAGGSTKLGSFQTVKTPTKDKNLPCEAYIAGYGLGPDQITAVLDQYKDLGIETIFVLRGDKPKNEDFIAHLDSFTYASDLITFISDHYDFTLGCAEYPEGHIEAQSLEKDMESLKLKVDNSAQYFYDNDYFFKNVEKCRQKGINVPILPGVMPVYTVKMTRALSRICGTKLTAPLLEKLEAVDAEDKKTVLDLGIAFGVAQCRDLLKRRVAGLHFYTMNRSRSTREIITRLRQDKAL